MKLVMLKCQSCGANLSFAAGQKLVTCQYCGTEYLVDEDGEIVVNNKPPSAAKSFWTTKHMLVLGAILFGVLEIANATNTRFRLLGLSIQELCLFTYALVLIKFRRVCHTKAAKVLSVVIWALAFFVLILQIIAWINNKSFTLLQLS